MNIRKKWPMNLRDVKNMVGLASVLVAGCIFSDSVDPWDQNPIFNVDSFDHSTDEGILKVSLQVRNTADFSAPRPGAAVTVWVNNYDWILIHDEGDGAARLQIDGMGCGGSGTLYADGNYRNSPVRFYGTEISNRLREQGYTTEALQPAVTHQYLPNQTGLLELWLCTNHDALAGRTGFYTLEIFIDAWSPEGVREATEWNSGCFNADTAPFYGFSTERGVVCPYVNERGDI